MKQSENIGDLLAALVEIQNEIPTMPKDSQAYGYKYADLDTITKAIKPVLFKHGAGYLQSVGQGDSGLTLTTRLFHKSGQWIEDSALLPVIANQKNNAAQTMGMSITYMRRYALSAMLGITSDEDTDANFSAPQKPLSPEAMRMKKASERKSKFTDAEKAEMAKWNDGTFTAEELAKIKASLNGEGWADAFNKAKAEHDKRAAGNPPEEIF